MSNIHLLIVDPQNDFCDIGVDEQPAHPLYPDRRIAPSLPVTGADADMKRLARWLQAHVDRVARVHVTLDSHQPFDIAHPTFWRDDSGQHPRPMTMIELKDLQKRRWQPADAAHEEHVLEYLTALERTGKRHMIWPEHCLVGSWGHMYTRMSLRPSQAGHACVSGMPTMCSKASTR